MNLEKETFLRVLKGAPLSVLLALWVHGAMDKKGLSIKTGWKEDTIGDALAFLGDLKLVERPHYRKWTVSDGFEQLPFPALAETRKNRVSEQLTIEVGAVDNFAETRKNRVSASSSSYIQEEERTNGRKAERPLRQPVYDFLRNQGVGNAMAERLARRDYVTLDYVAGHVAYVKRHGEPLRFALQRMKDGDGVPMEKTAVQAIPAEYRDIVKR